MTGRDGRRVRGSDGKLYDSKKQRDNGYQAHESRVGTAARRTKWRAAGVSGWVWGRVMELIHALLVFPKFSYYVLSNGLGKLFRPSEMADDISRIPRDLRMLPEFLCVVTRTALRPVTKIFSPSNWRGASKKYGRRSKDGRRK